MIKVRDTHSAGLLRKAAGIWLLPKAAEPRQGNSRRERLQHLPHRDKELSFFKDRHRGQGRFETIWCHIRKRRITELLRNSYCNSLEIVFSSVNHEIHFLLAQKIHIALLYHITYYGHALELLQMGLNIVNPGLTVRA